MMNLNALKIDPEFQGKIPPLNFEEEQQLEQNILHEGRLLNPIIIWNGFILDGHTRYRILRKHPFIAYQTQEIELDNRYAALSWICQNQLGRSGRCSPRCKRGNPDRAHQGNGRRNHRPGKNAESRNPCGSCRAAKAKAGTSAPKSRNNSNAF